MNQIFYFSSGQLDCFALFFGVEKKKKDVNPRILIHPFRHCSYVVRFSQREKKIINLFRGLTTWKIRMVLN